MIYKFKSKASGNLVMLGPDGDRLLRLIGREPAPRGIIEPAAMAAVQRLLQDAVAAESGAAAVDDGDTASAPAVRLKQRVWPMLQMLERAEAAGEPIVWGV